MPSSMTRLVEANMKATAAKKWATCMIRVRAEDNPAKEQDELMAPTTLPGFHFSRQGSQVAGRGSLPLGRTASITALMKSPSTKAQPDFQNKSMVV